MRTTRTLAYGGIEFLKSRSASLGDAGEDGEDLVHEAHERQVRKTMDTLCEGPEGF